MGRTKMKWEPAVPIKRPENIVLTQFKGQKPFVPSYENEQCLNFNYLMSWEYGRIWFKEKEKWDQLIYPPTETKETQAQDQVLLRKYVPRRIKRRGRIEKPVFKMKRFANARSKTLHNRSDPPQEE